MEQKRRPLKKKRKSPLIQFLPYIIIVVIAAALIVAVIVITDRKDEANEVKQTQVPQETNSSQDMAEGSMQVLNVERNQGDMDANGETNNSGELDTNQKIMNLIQSYFQAEEEGDAETLNQIMDTPNPVTKEHLDMLNEIIVDYQNIVCYVIEGLDDTSWITYISYDIKFFKCGSDGPILKPFYYSAEGRRDNVHRYASCG